MVLIPVAIGWSLSVSPHLNCQIILCVIKIIIITSINVTVQGQKHLGAVIGSRVYLEEYVSEKVTNWINDIAKLAEFALSQPHATQPTPLT